MSVFPKKSRFRNRWKRCYELSFRTLLNLAQAGHADGVTLVHGTISVMGGPIGHAWLESDGEAYDAVAHETMPIAQYVAEHGAIAERRYTLDEALKVSQAQKPRYYERHHYGPWHNPWYVRGVTADELRAHRDD
jgi:hypothetical protein